MSTEFALDLRLARRKAGLTQRDCAQLLAIPQSRLSAFEKGQLLPSVGQICQLSLIFGRSFESLYARLLKEARQVLKQRLPLLPKQVRSYVGTFNRTSSIKRMKQRIADHPDDHGGA